MGSCFFCMFIDLYASTMFLGDGNRFSVYEDIQGLALDQGKLGSFLGDGDLKDMVPEIHFEGIGVPLLGNLRLKGEDGIANPHSPKTFHDTHPGAGHGGDMQPFLHFLIVVVQI